MQNAAVKLRVVPVALDAEWRHAGVPLALADHPRNRRAEAQRRARASRNIFRRVCGGLSLLSFLFLLGSTGALEQETVTLSQGAAQMMIGVMGFGAFGKLSGLMW